MKCGVILAIVIAAQIFGGSLARAQVADPDAVKAQMLREERIRVFEAWRQGIPDYEMRLYERVSKVNDKVVSVQRTLVIGFGIVTVVLSGLLVYIAFFGTGRGEPAATGAPSLGRVGGLRLRIAQQAQARRQKQILHRQAMLIEANQRLLAYLQVSRQDSARLGTLLSEIQTLSRSIQNDIESETSHRETSLP